MKARIVFLMDPGQTVLKSHIDFKVSPMQVVILLVSLKKHSSEHLHITVQCGVLSIHPVRSLNKKGLFSWCLQQEFFQHNSCVTTIYIFIVTSFSVMVFNQEKHFFLILSSLNPKLIQSHVFSFTL